MRCRFLRKIRGGRPKALSFFEFICYNAVRRPQEQAAAIIKNLCPTTRQTSKAEITNKINNVPVVELDTIKASDAFGPGSRERSDAPPRGPLKGVSADPRRTQKMLAGIRTTRQTSKAEIINK